MKHNIIQLLFQVLSKSVSDAFNYYGEHDTIETQKFVRIFDRFFDMLNIRSLEEGIYKRKPDLLAYRTIDDSYFEVCIYAPALTQMLIIVVKIGPTWLHRWVEKRLQTNERASLQLRKRSCFFPVKPMKDCMSQVNFNNFMFNLIYFHSGIISGSGAIPITTVWSKVPLF